MSKTEVENNNNQTEDEKTEESVFSTKISTMTSQMDELLKTLKTMTVDLKTMKKEYVKLEKKAAALEKTKGRKKRSKEEGAEKGKNKGGFNKPTKVSEELSKFLKLEDGQFVSRPAVTTLMSNYIKEHDLKKEGDGRKIDMTKPGGEVLAKLLGVSVDTELNYFNLQTYLKPHYISVKEEESDTKAEKTEKTEKTEKAEKVEEDVKPRRRRHVEVAA